MSDNDQNETMNTSSSKNPPETPDDGKDLGIQVGVENGRVIVVFSQRLSTLGMPPDAADKMADALKMHAAEARKMGDG